MHFRVHLRVGFQFWQCCTKCFRKNQVWLNAVEPSLLSNSSILLALKKGQTIGLQRFNFVACLGLGKDDKKSTCFDYTL